MCVAYIEWSIRISHFTSVNYVASQIAAPKPDQTYLLTPCTLSPADTRTRILHRHKQNRTVQSCVFVFCAVHVVAQRHGCEATACCARRPPAGSVACFFRLYRRAALICGALTLICCPSLTMTDEFSAGLTTPLQPTAQYASHHDFVILLHHLAYLIGGMCLSLQGSGIQIKIVSNTVPCSFFTFHVHL